jgi:hypothetical protein
VHQFSPSVARIEMLRQEIDDAFVCAVETAFFYRATGKTYLINNWHNVTGVSPETGQALHSTEIARRVAKTV